MVPTLQQRIEASPWGRACISVLILLIVSGSLLWNLPESELQRRLVPFFRPGMISAGLDQNWEMFSPEPQKDTFVVSAKIEYADGSEAVWRIPRLKDRWISPYRIYRWRKFVEHVRLDKRSELWEPLARWVARSQANAGLPVRVTLVRRWHDLSAPGETSSTPPKWLEFEFFVFNVLEDRPE